MSIAPRATIASRRTAPAARLAAIALTLALSLMLAACGGGGGGGDSSGSSGGESKGGGGTAEAATAKEEASGASFKVPDSIRMPSVESSDGATIDTSGANYGYVGASAKSDSRLKFQVTCGEMTYNYDLPNDGTPCLFPVNMGNGSYSLRIMENIEGNSYAELESTHVDVSLESEFAPFLVPNIFCNYDADSICVKKARELMKDVTNQGEAVREVCTFVANNVTYDFDKANQLAQGTGYVPDPDSTLEEKSGICFDYASLSAAMLRSLGIPAKVITGYVAPDNIYHAWIMVYVDGTWQSTHFSVSPNTWSRCDVTFASTGSSAVTGDGTGYTDRYTY